MEKELNEKLINNTHNCIEYKGKITVSVLENERVLSKNIYYNNGTNKLFAFLTNCLSGDFNTARANRPCRLVLLTTADEEAEYITDSKPTDNNYSNYWSETYYAAPPVYYGKAPTTLGNKITYSFRVPFLQLQGGAKIKKMALVPELSSEVDDICAYYVLGSEIEVPTVGGNFTILVDWELSFNNKA